MPPINSWRIVPCNLIPWLSVLNASRGWEGHYKSFRRAIPPRFSTQLGAIQFVFHFSQIFLDFPCYLNLCHGTANLMIGHCQVQPCKVTIYLINSGLDGPRVEI